MRRKNVSMKGITSSGIASTRVLGSGWDEPLSVNQFAGYAHTLRGTPNQTIRREPMHFEYATGSDGQFGEADFGHGSEGTIVTARRRGMGLDFNSVWNSVVQPALSSAASSAAGTALNQVAQQPGVSQAVSQAASQSAANQVGAWLVQNWKTVAIAGVGVVGLIAYLAARKKS